MNDELGRLITRPRWTAIIVDDWMSEQPDKWADWERRGSNALGWVRHLYEPLGITKDEIDREIAARGNTLGS
jgi:hypothetical protein